MPREIEIWFVTFNDKFYVLAEHHERAQWVKNIRANPHVQVRVGTRTFPASARVLDAQQDHMAYTQAQQLARAKYDWGAGLPVEITPDPHDA